MPSPPFDLLASPLLGRTLIEASAGTGKTYTIAGLFVRLLIERGLEVDQILVVTYTEAATSELRERIRRRIVEAIEVFEGRRDDPGFLTPLRERAPDRAASLCRLRRGLIAFDQAAIHTIHGFCRRVLRDRAFEARALFDTELVTDLSALDEELADDFWRRRSTTLPPALIDYLIAGKFSPDTLVKLLRSVRRPERILPETPFPELASGEAACRELLDELRALWQRERDAIIAGVRAALPGLNGQSYSEGRLVAWERTLEAFFTAEVFWGAEVPLDKLGTFKVNKGGSAPSHPFHALCARFHAARQDYAPLCAAAHLALQREFLLWAEEEKEARKARHNVRTFDDLLLEVRRAIAAEHGNLLPALRATFRAVLIDEFQDTDPIQYAIFQTLCPDASATLFLIGDPKQAIYAFRGADIFTYLAATHQVEQRYTLNVNFRSAPTLVAGVNRLFRRENPFLFPEIPYPAVEGCASRNGELALLADGEPLPALQVWQVARAGEKAANKGEAVDAIVAAVTTEVVRLLTTGRLRLRDGRERPLGAGEIAILVRTNLQAAQLIESLRRAGVPGVRNGSESLFASREALELLWILQALANPSEGELLRAALATAPFGLNAARIEETIVSEERHAFWLERFLKYHDLWSRRGIAPLGGAMMAGEGVPARLLALPDGERRLTNLRHAFEVLQRVESESGLGIEGLLKWFSRHIAAPPEGEEYQLRLETDAEAVQVVTIHRSKGLEYPVCFVPFCWNSSRGRAENFHFHRADKEGDRGELCFDLGSPLPQRQEFIDLCARETLAENLRLFYVALTRAEAACYLVWGGIKDAETAAPSWLWHAPEEVPPGGEVAACAAGFSGLDDAAIRRRLEALVAGGEGISLADLPDRTVPPLPRRNLRSVEIVAPPPLPMIDNRWRLTSYSALAAGGEHAAEGEVWKRAERADGGAACEGAIERRTIHDFPAGAEAGSCLHDILEVVDFAPGSTEERRRAIAATLERYRIEPFWLPVVDALLDRIFAAPLDPAVPGLRLERVGAGARRSEMGFFLPLGTLTPQRLARPFERHRAALPVPEFAASVGRLAFAEVEGMLRGFIDLVFVHDERYYLIDWKSNRLGRSVTDYDQAALAAEMLASGYILQYHLYCVALHRHLQRAVPGYAYERHFGGVFYLFLRGIDPAAGDYGIYRDRPKAELIAALDRTLGGEEPYGR